MNDVTVGLVVLEQKYGLGLTNDSEFKPPTPKTYLLDLPGGDGSLDVTEAFGDTLYENREDTLVFYVPESVGDFEKIKTDVARFLHGRSFDYTLAFDPGYVRHGRFAIDEWYSKMHYRKIKISVSADPYKSGGVKVHEVDAQAGANLHLLPGRGRVRPVFESKMPIHVMSNGIDVTLPAGSHTAVGLTIRDGASDVYVNTGGSISGGNTTWGDLEGKTWGDLKGKKWHEVMWLAAPPEPNEAYRVKIAYEILEI